MNKVLLYLSPGFEEIEAVTIIDLLRRADIEVTIAGLEEKSVRGSHGIIINCDQYYENIDPTEYDYLVLPGGQPGTNNLKNNETVLKNVRHFAEQNKLIGAICAAPAVLLQAGIVKDIKITSYPSEKHLFNPADYKESSVVIDNNIITSRGVGTAIEFTLDLIGLIKGEKVKDELANKIVWTKPR